MNAEKLVWTQDMKETLLRFWQAGMDCSEIADRLGIKLEQVEGAIQRAKRGVWGNDLATRFRKGMPESTLDKSVAEADERGITYGALQTERRLAAERKAGCVTDPDESAIDMQIDVQIADPINMLEALDALVACSITQNGKITAVSAVEGQFADIAFVRCGSTYVLSLRREEQE